MDKNFSPADIEARWYDQWETRGYFAPSGQGPAYCIPIPPLYFGLAAYRKLRRALDDHPGDQVQEPFKKVKWVRGSGG